MVLLVFPAGLKNFSFFTHAKYVLYHTSHFNAPVLIPLELTLLSFGDYMQDLRLSLMSINSINTLISDHIICQQPGGKGCDLNLFIVRVTQTAIVNGFDPNQQQKR